ncbi:MAG TPA: sigma 54 modulation/S30EA ribosomal C-terminal domain-containing protein [Thermoanaerobaculia bacterium]|nr:sigma 54 modulation/S30EA ribosomal C-terminal domain-containing protein [Thermoanaerobaculia bacterium]
MPIEITGRHIDIPAREKTRVQERAGRLERHTGKIVEGRLIVTGEKHRVTADAMVTARRRNWQAKAASPDLAGAVAAVFDKLEALATKESARRKDHKGKTPARRAASELAADVIPPDGFASPPERRIVKQTRMPIKPMSAEEAALELEDSLHEFIVFHDASSERVSVLYKRRDGNFGLIAPEW